MQLIKTIIAILLIALPAWGYEDLTELEARVTRKDENTFYSGEDSGNYYIWQPQTVIYKDTTTNHEVWVWTQSSGNDVIGLYGNPEYGWAPWSADGKRIMWPQQYSSVGCYTRDYGHPWMISRSDGSYLRPLCDSANKTNSRTRYGTWSPVEPDVFFALGYNRNGNSGLDQNGVYRHTSTDTAITYGSIWVDLIPGNTSTVVYDAKQGISGDGRIFWATSGGDGVLPGYVARVYPEGEKELIVTWSSCPTLDSHWEDNPGGNHDDFHDECLGGNAKIGYWLYAITPDGGTTWWRFRPWGTDGGVPNHVSDTETPYAWWDADSGSPDEWDSDNDIPGDANKEIQCVNTRDAANVPDHVGAYWSHGMVDRWGKYTAYSDTETDPSPYGPSQWNVAGETQIAHDESLGGGNQYNVWAGWSDWSIHTPSPSGGSANVLGALKIGSTFEAVAYSHSSATGDFTSIGQSPDGTKANINTDWLDDSDMLIGVVYYPHPPEITACTATGGTVTTTFEWMLDSTPRGYTTRGWPDPDADDPPPPRETSKFRLWRSADKTTWTPISTTNAEIFTRYDFADGTWSGNDYWTITDTPGNGTWYYAVTSVEWSGLESRCLSNIYAITVSGGSGTGSQDTAYPASPGDLDNISTSDFYTSFNASNTSLIRYYNIYADDDGDTPTATQAMRIASIPATYDYDSDGSFSWVDWLGDTDGSTKYIVTAVDTQGNESSALSTVTYTHKDGAVATADGQYLITWEDGGSSPSTPSIRNGSIVNGVLRP